MVNDMVQLHNSLTSAGASLVAASRAGRNAALQPYQGSRRSRYEQRGVAGGSRDGANMAQKLTKGGRWSHDEPRMATSSGRDCSRTGYNPYRGGGQSHNEPREAINDGEELEESAEKPNKGSGQSCDEPHEEPIEEAASRIKLYFVVYHVQNGWTELSHSGPRKRNVSGGRWGVQIAGEQHEPRSQGKWARGNGQSKQLDRFNWLLSICAGLNPEGSTNSRAWRRLTALASHHPAVVHLHAHSGKT